MAEEAESLLHRVGRGLRDLVTHNLPLKLVSLAIAVGLWAFVNIGERDSEEAIKVPVELRQIPAALMITSPRVDFVDVRVVGPRTLLGRIDYGQLSIALDLSGALPGPAVFTVNVDRLNLPRGVRVVRVTPAQITVTLERIGRKVVPVVLSLSGQPPTDFHMTAVRVSPEEVEITGPDPQVEAIESVTTEALRLNDESRASMRRELAIEPMGEYVKARPAAVAVEVDIEELQVERAWEAVPIGVMATGSGEVQIEPAVATLVLRGPRRVIEPIVAAGLLGIDAARLAIGAHIAPLVPNLPDEVTLVSLEPTEVTVTIVAPTPPPDADAPPETPAGPNPTPLGAR